MTTPDKNKVNLGPDDRPQYGISSVVTNPERGRDFPQYQIPSSPAKTATLPASSGTPIVEDEGSMLTVRAILNFVGAGVTAADNPTYGRTDITIPSASPTFGTPAIVLGTAAANGATNEVIRRDSTIVVFDVTVPVTQAFGDAAATGSVAFAARRDHKHGMPATPQAYATVQDEGTPLTQRITMNFVGAGVTAADSGGVTTVTIAGGGGSATFAGSAKYGGF